MMANGMIMGGRPSGGNRSGWEVAVVEIPQMNLSSVGDLYSSDTFGGKFQIPFPLTIGGRTFNNWADFWMTTGIGNFMVSVLAFSNRLVGFVGANIASNGGRVDIIQRGNNTFAGGTLYIYCRFTD